MRFLLDANIFISYLLNPKKPGALQQIVHGAIRGEFTLLLPAALLDEFVSKIPQKPFLHERITYEELSSLVKIMKEVGVIISEIEEEIPAVTRDPKDDYLLAYAVIGEADYLVTVDEDLLVLQQVGSLQIIKPVDFVTLIEG